MTPSYKQIIGRTHSFLNLTNRMCMHTSVFERPHSCSRESSEFNLFWLQCVFQPLEGRLAPQQCRRLIRRGCLYLSLAICWMCGPHCMDYGMWQNTCHGVSSHLLTVLQAYLAISYFDQTLQATLRFIRKTAHMSLSSYRHRHSPESETSAIP